MQQKPITLRDIAEQLGVSVSTVSRVLTEKDRVNPETRRRVKEALEAANYIPNEMAQVLRGGPCRSIGVIVPTLDSGFYTRIITSAQNEALKSGYAVIVCTGGHDPAQEKNAMCLLASKHLTGVLCASELEDAAAFYRGFIAKTPVVFFDTGLAQTEGFGNIYFDAHQAAAELTERLLRAGHRSIAMLSHNCPDRQHGFRCALEKYGITPKEWLLVSDLHTYADGLAAVKRLLTAQERPSAIFATNDFLAYAAVKCAKGMGMRVPEELSVVGFDAYDPTGLIEPRLTCVMQDTDLIGREAVRMLLAGSCGYLELPYSVIEGETVKSLEGY